MSYSTLVHILRRDKNQAGEKKTDSLWQGFLGYNLLKCFSELPFWMFHTLGSGSL